MALNVTRGKITKAQKVVVYGTEGIGKTSFAAQFPNPLFIDTEGSTEHYDVARTEAPQSWSMLLAQVQEVKATHPCDTLVIDTADWAEKLCIAHVCAANKWTSIEDPGYGKGYTPVVEEFGKLLNLLSDVIEAGMNVVLTAHASIRKFDQPDESASYNRWALSLIDATKMSNSAKVKEWADTVLFVNFITTVETVGTGKQAKGKARGGQKRIMHCQHHACWDAKNRWGLPEEVPFDYAQVARFIPVATTTPIQASAPQDVLHAQQTLSNPHQGAIPTQKPVSSTPATTTQTREPAPIQTIVYGQDGTVVSNSMEPALPEYWSPALQLMEADGVTLDEIKAMSVDKGFFSKDTPIENYPKEYIDGGIIAQWGKCVENIRAIRARSEPVPFGAPDMTKI